MNETASVMKKEINQIAAYRALIISKRILSALLLPISLYLIQKRYPASSFYILLILNILPSILIYAFKDLSEKYNNTRLGNLLKEPDFLLQQLKSKYKYSRLLYIAHSTSYLLNMILILLWQINYNITMPDHTVLAIMPVVILAFGLLIRFCGFIVYRIKLPYDIRHNKN